MFFIICPPLVQGPFGLFSRHSPIPNMNLPPPYPTSCHAQSPPPSFISFISVKKKTFTQSAQQQKNLISVFRPQTTQFNPIHLHLGPQFTSSHPFRSLNKKKKK